MNEAAPFLPPTVAQSDLALAECVRLRAELRALAAFIPATIVRQQLANPAGARVNGAYWDGSVLFADLSGFTALSEQLSALGKQGAEEISAIINRLFGALQAEILRYGGEVLKFGGDALTAFFDIDALGPDHAALAARAALALQERMREFDALETRAGVFRLRLRIGVHSGRVFAAQVGDAEHIELVITGRNINRVALAQEISETGEVVVSAATAALLHGAATAPRQAGFHLLERLPEIARPIAAAADIWPDGAGDAGEVAALELRIAALRPYLPRQLPRRFLEQSEGESGEFRPVSALFANFFPFSNALDLLNDDVETAALVLNAYYQRAQQVVHRYGGIVNKVDMYTYGDKLMALFGAPTAHENDPELAVRAALDLRVALDQANHEIVELLRPAAGQLVTLDERFLRQRVGINTGVMFAGLVGSARRREYTVMGQHVNLAARLMSAADEGTVVVSPATRRVVERHIALRPLDPVRLKGIAEPVALAEALRPFDVAQEQPRGLLHAPLVGRSAEIEQLLDEGGAALRGQGRVVALLGEAGVGKSRLLEETLQRLVLRSADPISGVPPFFPYSAECQSYEQNTPYALARQLMRQVLHLGFAESAGDARLVQRRVAEITPDLARFAPLLSDLTVAQIEDTPLTAALSPEQRRDRALELAEALVLNAARQQPVVAILDDLHWADASSLDLVARLVRHADTAPLLLLLGYRTEPRIDEPWAELAHGRRLMLRELTAEGEATLVGALLGAEPPPEMAVLLEKTQGNPFYIEEVVRGLVEAGTLAREGTGWRLTRPVDETTVPDSIEGVITARLDRLEERSREVLQVASVVGRRFPYQVLLGLLLRTDDLQERLGRLTEADIILIEEIERELGYLFKHALTRDVAYEAILYARRRELHRNVARQIERIYPDRLDDQLGVLARHYLLAEEWPQAFDYHVRAGRQAQNRYANREAIGFFERALEVAARVQGSGFRGQGLETGVQVIELHERLGVIHALIGEYDAALARYEQALALLEAQADALLEDRVRLHHYIARVHEKRAEFETAFDWVERALALDPHVESAETVRCLLLGAGIHKRQGRYAQALEWGERARNGADRVDRPREKAHALKLLGNMHRSLGDNGRALDLLNECIQLYGQTNDLAGLADAHNDLANTYYDLGQLDLADTNYQAGAAIKESIGDVYGQAMIANNLGELYKLQQKLDDALASYQRSLEMFELIGSTYAVGILHMNLGATNILLNRLDTAEQHFVQSADRFERTNAEDFLPELERYLAELQLRRGDFAKAQLAAEIAFTTANRLEARTEAAITRRVLAEIYLQSSQFEQAWSEIIQSIIELRSAGNPLETLRALLLQARIAPYFSRLPEGQAAIDEATILIDQALALKEREELRAIVQHYASLTFFNKTHHETYEGNLL